VEQFAYLLDQLKARPEGEGTMLDHSVVVLVTEVCDGNTHSHDDMPFVLAGRAGGAIRPGRLLSYDYARHGGLWASVANAMGQSFTGFGDSGGRAPGRRPRLKRLPQVPGPKRTFLRWVPGPSQTGPKCLGEVPGPPRSGLASFGGRPRTRL
jgi:hypothetical protein